MGPGGGVIGVLKKRVPDQRYNLVSALGAATAEDLLTLWKWAPLAGRANDMCGLGLPAKEWGIQPRDQCAIGANLVVRAANLVAAEDVRRAALRHEPVLRGPRKRPPPHSCIRRYKS
jgi:hypothetical protein